jgi:hypothetical protein
VRRNIRNEEKRRERPSKTHSAGENIMQDTSAAA